MAQALKRDSYDLTITMHDAALAVKVSYPRDFTPGLHVTAMCSGASDTRFLDLEIPDGSPAQAVSLSEHD